MKKANIVSAIVGMGFSAVAFFITFGFKKFRNVPVGPEFFPRMLAVVLFICSAVLLAQALMIKKENDKPGPTLSFRSQGMRRLLAGAAIIVIYAFGWEPVGFIIMTPLVLFTLMFLLGLRRLQVMVTFSIAATAVIFCAFRYFLGIDMPMGILYGIF
ncbi:MAG: tripartite tricarboxylate transporter TctB family protein [Treponema sp.]|nr:tripartite tricarboxylate transporter TctB family protein [Treponema sp.]